MSDKNQESRRKLDEFIGERFRQFLDEYLRKNGMTKKQFATEVIFVNPNVISRWSKGTAHISSPNLLRLSEVFGVDIKDFYPKTYEEKYQFDSEYTFKKGHNLAEYAHEKGLHLGFLRALVDMIDFEHDYPTQMNIGYEVDPETGDIRFFHGRGRVSAKMDAQNYEMLQYKKGDDWVMMSPKDIGFLLDVQESVVKYVKYLFWVRAGQMVDEIKALNDRKLNRRDALRSDGYTIDLSDEEDAKIDGYVADAIREVDPYIAYLTDHLLYDVNNALKKESESDSMLHD